MPWEPLPTRDASDSPAPVREGLDRLVKGLGGSSAATLGAVFARWPEVVGEGLAAHTKPLSMRDGVLLVAVDDPAWAPELRFLEPRLLERLGAVLGERDIDRIEVRVRPPNA